MFWYAVQTRPCQEKRASDNLNAWGIETLAPCLPRRAAPFPRPLFPSYIFARFDVAKMLHNVHFTRGVSNVVSFGGKPAIILDEIIATIRNRVDDHGSITREIVQLKTGDPVLIAAGPLQNLKGVFERELPDGERVRILLDTIAYSAHIELLRSEISKIPGTAIPKNSSSGERFGVPLHQKGAH